jgi:hypothetical protein
VYKVIFGVAPGWPALDCSLKEILRKLAGCVEVQYGSGGRDFPVAGPRRSIARINRVFTPVRAVPGILLLSLIESACVLPTPPPS